MKQCCVEVKVNYNSYFYPKNVVICHGTSAAFDLGTAYANKSIIFSALITSYFVVCTVTIVKNHHYTLNSKPR